jgi:Ca-activated chloride channel family protein
VIVSWANPEFFRWLWAVPLLAAVMLGSLWWTRRSRSALADAPVRSRVVVGDLRWEGVVRVVLASLAAVATILAMARPQWGEKLVPAPTRGADVVLVVDASLSMLARDAVPDRLGLARRDLRRLVDSLGPSRIGLVVFAGSAIRQIPFTEDRGALATLLDALSPDMVPQQGTDLGVALRTAASMMSRSIANRKVVVLVTDGGDHGTGAQEGASAVASAGAHLWVVGVGGPVAVPIPLPEGGTKTDPEGNIVTVRLEREPLQAVAKAAGGVYGELSATTWNLAPVAHEVNAVVAEGGRPGTRLVRIDRFPLFLGAALLFLLLELALPRGGKRRW